MNSGPVWIDLANSPHVLFFAPVRNELLRRGVQVVVTARDFSQTVPLCRSLGIPAVVLGRHGGQSLARKAVELARTVKGLRAFCREFRPSVAVGHASYGLAVTGRSLDIPVLTAMDYEHQPANHVAFRCATVVAVPDLFPLDCLRRQGASHKAWRFSGLKEQIALAGFLPDDCYLSETGIDAARVVVVVRPPADMALYHRFGNPLFEQVLRRLQREDGLSVVLLARTNAQAQRLERAGFGDLLWCGEPLDGRQLIAAADVVVSAGGSMNREAAVLGTPAYSAYAGRLAAIDRALIADGRLQLLRDSEDVGEMRLVKKPLARHRVVDEELLQQFVDEILQLRDDSMIDRRRKSEVTCD